MTMFERFTATARQAVVCGQQEARGLGHCWVGTEHLLLGVLAQRDAPGVSALTELGVTLDTGREALGRVVGGAALGASDSEALRTLGIDLGEVRTRVEAVFGPGALDRPPHQGSRRRLRWRRCRPGDPSGHLPFMPRAKRALERALDEARALGDRHIGVEHILLGLLDPKGNMAVELLRYLGTDPRVVRACVLDSLGKAA
jgi:ATP-dependent Clp protease ATP-binding subunit ClpA